MNKANQDIPERRGGLIGCLARLVRRKPKAKVYKFNPMLDGAPKCIFENKTDLFVPEMTIGRKFKGPDGGEWIVVKWEPFDENRDTLPHDGIMTIQSNSPVQSQATQERR